MAQIAQTTDFRVRKGLVVENTATILSTIGTTGTNSGALQVTGGVGIGGGLFVGGVLTATTIYGNFAGSVLGTISTATGALTVQTLAQTANSTYYPTFVANNSTLTVFQNEYTTSSFSINPATGVITLNSTTISTNEVILGLTSATSTSSGALQVKGGVGIGGNLYVGGSLNIAGAQALTLANITANTQTLYVSLGNGSDTNNGTTLLSPFATLAKALSVATTGTLITIAPGTYTETWPLTVPKGVSVQGAGIRSTTIQPTSVTNTLSGFLLNGETLLTDLTIANFYQPGYGIAFAPGCNITTRSPYVERISIITRGTTSTLLDPFGYASGNAGNGVYLDASILNANSLEPAMLFNEFTAIVPNATGMYMTNGARAELLNGFFYFANTAINTQAGLPGFAGAGQTRLKLVGVTGSFNVGDTITYKTSATGTVLASGTIASTASGYIYLNGPVWGFRTGSASSTQTVISSSGGSAQYMSLADYHQFGAELRCIGSAAVFGNTGVVANGTGTDLKLIAFNMSNVGAQGNLTDDFSLTTGANQVIATNGGQIFSQIVDQNGNFSVGRFFNVNGATGVVSFGTATFATLTFTNITLYDGFNTTTLQPTGLVVNNNLTLTTSTVATTGTTDLFLAGGTGFVTVNGTLRVTGSVTATTFVGNLLGTATNIAGGAIGSIPIQNAAGTTAFIPLGNTGYVLTAAAGNTATWQALSGLAAGTATNAINVQTQAQPVGGTYYPTFVNANNINSAFVTEYTTSTLSINPATGILSAGSVAVTTSGTFGTAASNTVVAGIYSNNSVYASFTSNAISSSAQVNLDNYSSTVFRTAKYVVQIVDGTKVHVAEYLLFHDGTYVYLTPYAVSSNTGELGTFDAQISGGTVTLLFTPNYTPSSMIIKVVRTGITA
jgi:hypothetical protein